MEIVTQDVDEYNDDEKASEKVMLETEMDKNNSAIETNLDSMETEEPAKVDDNVIAQKSKEILDQGKLHDYRTCAIITRGLYTFYPLFEVH